MTPFEALIAELENAAGMHYIHSSPETLERLEKARAALLSAKQP